MPATLRTAVYRLYDDADRLLYVGIGSSPPTRYRAHARRKAWWPQVARRHVTWYADRRSAELGESDAIRDERPLHNVAKGAGDLEWLTLRSRYGRESRRVWDSRRIPFGQRIAVVWMTRAHVVIADRGQPTVVVVPMDWYRRVSELDGDPTDL